MLLKHVFLNGKEQDILIKGNRIFKIADEIDVSDTDVWECRGKAILPTFCNTHTHASMMFLRGVGEDKSLYDWLNQDIWPREAKLKAEHFYALSRYAIMEMIRTGTTCFADMYFEVPETIKAADEMGIRAILPYPGMDLFDESEADRRIERAKCFLNSPSPTDRIQKCVYCHAIYTCSEKIIKGFKALADQYDTYLQLHISETQKEVDDCIAKYGCRPVELLYRWGILGPKTLLAHCVHLNEHETDLMKQTGTSIAHCPTSNLKLGSGQMDLQGALDKGIRVTLGTDGVASNNSLSMIQEMKMAALSGKNRANSVLAANVADIWKIATQNGFEAFGVDAGVIAEGKLADFMLVDLNNQFLCPNHTLISNMVYAADSSCITDVVCDGHPLMRNRIIPHEAEIRDEFCLVSAKLSV